MIESIPGAEVYLVGGAVRDRLLGCAVKDRDYVVVGATPEQMQAQGFQPVGKDFPVFLHPVTKEEYALARTERKTAPGYTGFAFHAAPDVTLKQDLARRDLTINALAQTADGDIIDPFGGLADLEARVLRHVSPAFIEDPVRILRLARFAARLAEFGFQVAPETLHLMQCMVDDGEVDALVPERVWNELVGALGTAHPAHFFMVLRECGALARLLPEVDRLWGVPQPPRWHPEIDTGVHVMLVLEMAAQLSPAPEVRFAALCHDLGKGTTPNAMLPRHHGHEERGVELISALCHRLRIPQRFAELARLVARYHGKIHKVTELRTTTILDLLQGVDVFRRPQRLEQLLLVCEADCRGRTGYANHPYPQTAHWQALAQACQAVDASAIARATLEKSAIPNAIRQARLAALRAVVKS